MKSSLINFNKKLSKNINRYPPFVYKTYFFLNNVIKEIYFRNERLFLKGRLAPRSTKNSIIFFTIHKCASTYLKEVFYEISAKNDYIPLNLLRYLTEQSNELTDPSFLERTFQTEGYFLGPFRFYLDIPNLDQYKVLLILRDPRDVLTSDYFSTSYSHPIVSERNRLEREAASKMDIDEYVIGKLSIYKARYQMYIDKLIGKENVLFMKYEDMIDDFPAWIKRIVDFLDMNNNNQVVEKIINDSNFEVNEDPRSFKRNIKAGDHKRKLKKETIDHLNRELKSTLVTLGFE